MQKYALKSNSTPWNDFCANFVTIEQNKYANAYKSTF